MSKTKEVSIMEAATATVIRLTAKSLGYMDQGMGHGHYGWIPNSQPNALTQEEFYQLHVALDTLGAFKQAKEKP